MRRAMATIITDMFPRLRKQSTAATCELCHRQLPTNELVPLDLIRSGIAALVKQHHPDLCEGAYICLEDLNRFRMEYVRDALESESGEISTLEEDVLKSLAEHEILSSRLNRQFETAPTFGQGLADLIAEFGGSWRFILLFGVFLIAWIIVNTAVLAAKPPDPYPFILLNLILSCLAALQAPVIMMSQNRIEAKDRLRAEHDYKINLKAELEIRHLNEKLDHLLKHQSKRLFEIQQIQLDFMRDLAEKQLNRSGNGHAK
jgi:uncharacterized membrane protein